MLPCQAMCKPAPMGGNTARQPCLKPWPWLPVVGDQGSNWAASEVAKRQRGDSNPCGQSPMDFESISLTARTHCHMAAFFTE